MSVAAGIVTYNPDIEILKNNITSVVKQVDYLIIVDNNSINIREIAFLVEDLDKVKLILNVENLGIARALNQVMEIAENDAIKWVLLLDQDTVISNNYVSNIKKYFDISDVAIVTPKIIDRKNLIEYDTSQVKEMFVSKCITSGSLNRLSVWRQIGGFDDSLFIDGVDHDYCFRVIKTGYKILKTNRVVIEHRIGDAKIFNLFGIKIKYFNHSPIRKYYIVRNILYFDKKNNKVRLSTFLRIIKQYLFVLFFEENKAKKFFQMSKGVRDGIRLKKTEIKL